MHCVVETTVNCVVETTVANAPSVQEDGSLQSAGLKPEVCIWIVHIQSAAPDSTPSADQPATAVCSLKCAVCRVQCKVCSVQCAVCSVQCTVCSVQRIHPLPRSPSLGGVRPGRTVHPPASETDAEHCKLHTAHCTLHTENCTMQTANCALQTECYRLHTAHFKQHTEICTLQTEKLKL